MNRYLGLLLAVACTREKPAQAPVADTPVMATRRLAPNVDTTYSADTTKHGDTTFFHLTRVITTFRVQAPAQVGWIPYGPAQAPTSVLCDTSQGYTGTIVGVMRAKWVWVSENGNPVLRQDTLANRKRNDGVKATLDSLATCGDKVALRIAREELRDSVTRLLSVNEALRELRTWPKEWATHPATLGIHLGDDPADAGWGYTMSQRLVKWDSIACGAQQRFGTQTPMLLRARPVQMEEILKSRPAGTPADKGWGCMTTGMAQWVHRLGDPVAYFQKEIASAKKQKLGFVSAMNLLNGGCGNLPASTRPPLRAACFAPGTTVKGPDTGFYWMSPDEITLVGNASIADQYVCGNLSWTYGGNYPQSVNQAGQHFHQVPANVAALRAVGEKARLHPPTSCIQR